MLFIKGITVKLKDYFVRLLSTDKLNICVSAKKEAALSLIFL